MANSVFANGLEVACKVSDGKSIAAFPDPCWSPPSPPAGPVVIPYANTAYAKDLANGSKTVLIGGKPIVLKDKSYLKTSTGNEAATRSFGQGLITGTIKGKTYFTSWSMNVMVEGLNVTRHTDLTTHNHGSSPGNTAPWAYLSQSDKQADCKETIKKVDKKCKVSKEENKQFREKMEKRNKINAERKKKRKNNRQVQKYKVRNKTWKDKHCKQLAIKPHVKALSNQAKELKNGVHELRQEVEDQLKHQGVDIIAGAAADYAERAAKKHVAALGCGVLGPVGAAACEVGVTVYNVVDSIITIFDTTTAIWDARDVLQDVTQKLDDLKEFSKGLDEFKDVLQLDKDSPEYQALQKKVEERASIMAAAAEKNPCVKARKCMLVPFTKLTKQGKKEATIAKSDIHGKLFGDKRGCCPGQTGHHLIPDSWAKNACANYKKGDAPVVCVEGVLNTHGSHGRVHLELDRLVDENRKAIGEGTPVSIDKAIDMAVESHKAKVGADCDEKCTRAQLAHYYNQAQCKDMLPTTKNETGKCCETAIGEEF